MGQDPLFILCSERLSRTERVAIAMDCDANRNSMVPKRAYPECQMFLGSRSYVTHPNRIAEGTTDRPISAEYSKTGLYA
jgi:hypothetical protein